MIIKREHRPIFVILENGHEHLTKEKQFTETPSIQHMHTETTYLEG